MTRLHPIDTNFAEPATPARVVLRVDDLHVSYPEAGGRRTVLHGVSLSLRAGEILALVGESGSGKTTTAQAVIGLLAPGARIDQGTIQLAGRDVTHLPARQFNPLRGAVISLVPQDPGTSLNPLQTIGRQVAEVLRLHGTPRVLLRGRVLELLAHVGLSEPERRIEQYPHELSGGMRQRVLIAIAIALKPAVIIADEPTSALDVTVQKRILDLIDDLRREHGTAVLMVTHDLAVAADRADRVVVLKAGQVQEAGPTRAVLADPHSAYTRQLLRDAPALAAAPLRPHRVGGPPVVVVDGLVQEFPAARGQTAFRAVDGLSFTVAQGTTHGIVGESGSGKTTAMRSIVGLARPTAGQITVAGHEVTALAGRGLRELRADVQLVYQNPFASLDPRQTVQQIIEEPLLNFGPVSRAERKSRVEEMLTRVALAGDLLSRKPSALSGGQRQRVAIARALVLRPKVVVLDEAVSALDVTVQAQVLRLLEELQRDLGLTYLFVSHDLSVIRAIADTVSVLHRGRQVEYGPTEQIFNHPQDDYTRALLASIPGQKRHFERTGS
ncbi:ABC transporter ATP-binding protein [Pseudotabrizicola sp. 4114]|uniref:ABC transporter ATP-binding protein n=1 Tax=Pseudotabrizicola sp. 4114 TaxID=2817731 RepID=UPI0028678D83|nr:peptide/nickel transport system ATP-binding protein [Pseudorhodobacter sp. 4114]